MLTVAQIEDAASALKGIVRTTEVIHSPYYSRELGAPLYFKCENLQYTGSFKVRGAYNFLLRQTPGARRAGVVTASAGNHAQGVAKAASMLNCSALVVMPEGTPLAKELATQHYGAAVLIHGHDYDAAEHYARELAVQEGKLYVPAFDDELIMAGQGTIGRELIAQLPEVQTVLIPVGGGGLIAGVATVLKEHNPQIRVIGIEARCAASAAQARQAGRPVYLNTHEHSLADGIAVKQIGQQTFPVIERYVDELISVDEEAIAMAMVSLMEKAKLVVEGAGAVGLAALLYSSVHLRTTGATLCLLSGGNLDVQTMARVVERGMLSEGRYLKLRLEMLDTPGVLARVTQLFSELKANIFQVSHDRLKSSLPLGEAEVVLELETRGPEHIAEILRRLAAEGYRPEVLT